MVIWLSQSASENLLSASQQYDVPDQKVSQQSQKDSQNDVDSDFLNALFTS